MFRATNAIRLPERSAGQEQEGLRLSPFLEARGDEAFRLGQRVELALRATGYLPLRGVEVSIDGQRAILTGRVPSYYLKQIAQTAALSVPGVLDLRNDVQVIRPS
jgi:osmotically-inducible protein OsmY